MEPLTTLALVAAFIAPVPLTRRPDWIVDRQVRHFINSTTELVSATSAPTESILMAIPQDTLMDGRMRLTQEIKAYQTLVEGWDGEGSVQAASESVAFAMYFIGQLPGGLPLPHTMLSSSGEVGCYWDGESGYADISFSPDGTASFFSRTSSGEEHFAESLPREIFVRNWFFDRLGPITAPKLDAA